MPTATVVTKPEATETSAKPLQTVGDALAKARGYIEAFSADAVAASYPELRTKPVAAAPLEEPEEPEVPVTPAATEESAEEPKAPEETQEEPKPAEETAEADEEFSVPPEIQESINKRIGKEVGKTKAERELREQAETRASQLEAELNQLRGAPPERQVVSTSMPLAEVVDLSSLQRTKNEAQGLKAQVEDLLATVEDDPQEVESKLRGAGIAPEKYFPKSEPDEEDYSVKRMRRTLRRIDNNLRQTLERYVPEREAFLKTESELKDRLYKEMPEVRNPTSERGKIMHDVLSMFPEVKLNPRWPLLVGAQVMFLEAAAKTKAQTNGTTPVTKPTAPKIPAKPKSAPNTATTAAKKDTEMGDLRTQILKGDSEARVQYLQRLLEAQ